MEAVTQEEAQKIQEIIYGYFQKEFGSAKKADLMMQKLAGLLQDPGVKLVQFGNTVFLVILVEPQVAEVHTMAVDEKISTLAQNFVLLSNFLKEIGVLEWYAYSDNPIYKAVAKKTKLPLELEEMQSEDGKTYTIYRMRFR